LGYNQDSKVLLIGGGIFLGISLSNILKVLSDHFKQQPKDNSYISRVEKK